MNLDLKDPEKSEDLENLRISENLEVSENSKNSKNLKSSKELRSPESLKHPKREKNLKSSKKLDHLKNQEKMEMLEKLKNTKPKYGPMSDVIFKCLFGNKENEKITKSFLESVLGEKIESITTDCKLELPKSSAEDKKMETDVIAKDNLLRKYIIEMQRRSHSYLPERFMGYLARTYIADIKVKEQYDTLTRTVMIIIMKQDFPNIKDIKKYHTIWNIRERDYSEKVLSNKLEIHILELNKYKKQKKKTGEIDPWLEFFLDPYGEEVINMARTYEELRAAVDQLNMLEADEEVRNLADAEAWARYDKFMIEAEEKEKLAKAEETARAAGMKKGMKKGMEKGMAEGRANEKIDIAKNMIRKKINIDLIKEITGLTKEEIENLIDKQ